MPIRHCYDPAAIAADEDHVEVVAHAYEGVEALGRHLVERNESLDVMKHHAAQFMERYAMAIKQAQAHQTRAYARA